MSNRKKTHRQAIADLRRLAKVWPSNIMLFAAAGSLFVVDIRDNRIVADEIIGIPCDGGDPGIVNRNGSDYLDLDPRGIV